ncbi:MAG: hypothetical protein JSS27_08945 [Planctomycetes bacterium]|nr:hypothetical protein [Planctomycetota bacterium]
MTPEQPEEFESQSVDPHDFAELFPHTIEEFSLWMTVELQEFESRWIKLAAPRAKAPLAGMRRRPIS